MNDSPNRHDLDVLRTIAALCVVTVHQLALLSGRKQDTLRHQVGLLEKRQLVQVGTMAVGGGRGRPEKILSLTSLGLKLLCDAGFDLSEKAKEPVVMLNPKLVRHQLLIGTFRAHLSLMTRTWPEFRVKFLLPSDSGLAGRDDNERASLVPDAILGLSHTGLGGTLLFFLEADRGTETLASNGGGSDIAPAADRSR
ncbi:MAG: replication-relaxation family protein [Planctomycetota bacterium]|nr:replication-relaxation family protein [Planctomycetota bacterium]